MLKDHFSYAHRKKKRKKKKERKPCFTASSWITAPCCSRRTSQHQTEESREPITPQGLWWNLIKKFVGKLILTKHKGHADAAVAVNWTWQWGKSTRQHCVYACVCVCVSVCVWSCVRVKQDNQSPLRLCVLSPRTEMKCQDKHPGEEPPRPTHTPSNASLSRARTQVWDTDCTIYVNTHKTGLYKGKSGTLITHTIS